MIPDPKITQALAKRLVATQFPQWASLDVTPVATSGWDNRTFHLGDAKLIRLPSAERYAAQPEKEWAWLPHLAAHLTVPLPAVLGQGQPTQDYPFCWSVLSFLPGETLSSQDGTHHNLARDLARFLNALRQVPTKNGPAAGQHNFYRGGDLRVYDQDIRHALHQISGIVDADQVLKYWDKACHSAWSRPPVWVHGDVAVGNVLKRQGRLAGVIDFGGCGIGDPACDLTIAWTLFDDAAADIFRDAIDLDQATWDRARGWALWKACLTCATGDPAAPALVQRLCAGD